jgi:hypothetical protein
VKGFDTLVTEGQTYATEEMVLEVELEVGVLLDSAKDLKSVLVSPSTFEWCCLYLDTLCGDL